MNLLKSVVGIDISKDDFHVCLKQLSDHVVVKGSRSFSNTPEGFNAFSTWISSKVKDLSTLFFVMEATGIYHENVTHYLYSNGFSVSVVLANKIKYFAKSLNLKTKTDKADASMIASYGLERNPDLWKPMIPQYATLRQLSRELSALKKDLIRYKAQRHALSYAHDILQFVSALKDEQISFIEKAISTVEEELLRTAKGDIEFDKRVKKLETIPGIRRISILIILCETNGFELFSNIRQVVSYSGLDITEKQSGKFNGKSKISKKGNSRIRHCLYMPSLTACRYNVPIKNLYDRIIEKNPTTKKKGVVAGMRKLLSLCFVLWKKNEVYNIDYQWNNKQTSGNDEAMLSYSPGSKIQIEKE